MDVGERISLPSRPRILIVRLSAIGDAVLTLPVLCALRRRFPDAFLAWVTEPGPARILRGHRALDELIELPKGWMKSVRNLREIRRRLRELRFDAVVDPQSLTKSALPAWLSGAKYRIGLARPFGRELAPLLNNVVVRTTGPHVVQHMLQLVRPLGGDADLVEFGLPSAPDAAAAANEVLRATGMTGRFLAVNPGAEGGLREWPADRYAELVRRIWHTYQVPSLILWGTPREQATANRIAHLAGEGSCAAPPTSLTTLIAVLRRATLLVSHDTGPLHMAAAVGTRCVGLYGPTWPEYSGPFGPGHIVVRGGWRAPHPLRWRSAPADVMLQIPTEEVFRACAALLRRDRAA